MPAFLDPTIPRDADNDAFSARGIPRPKSNPPDKGWRESLRQCNFKPRGVRCQAVAAPRSTLCPKHDEAHASQRYFAALMGNNLGERYQAAAKDPQLKDSGFEIAAAQTLAEYAMESVRDPEAARAAIKDLDLVTRMQERALKGEIDRQAVWGHAEVRAFFIALGQIVNRTVLDERTRQALVAGIDALGSGMIPMAAGVVVDA